MGKEAEAEDWYLEFRFQLVWADKFTERIVKFSPPRDLERKQD